MVTTVSDVGKAGESGGGKVGPFWLWEATAEGEDGTLLLAAEPGIGMDPPGEGGVAVGGEAYEGEAPDATDDVDGLYGDAVWGDAVIPEGI